MTNQHARLTYTGPSQALLLPCSVETLERWLYRSILHLIRTNIVYSLDFTSVITLIQPLQSPSTAAATLSSFRHSLCSSSLPTKGQDPWNNTLNGSKQHWDQETDLTPNVKLHIQNYTIVRNDREGRIGGSVVFTKCSTGNLSRHWTAGHHYHIRPHWDHPIVNVYVPPATCCRSDYQTNIQTLEEIVLPSESPVFSTTTPRQEPHQTAAASKTQWKIDHAMNSDHLPTVRSHQSKGWPNHLCELRKSWLGRLLGVSRGRLCEYITSCLLLRRRENISEVPKESYDCKIVAYTLIFVDRG